MLLHKVPHYAHSCIFMNLEIKVELFCQPDLPLIIIESFLRKAYLISRLLQSVIGAALLRGIINPLPNLEAMFGLSNRSLLRFSIDGSFSTLIWLFSLAFFSKLEIEFIPFLSTQLYKYVFGKRIVSEKLTDFCSRVHVEYLSMCEKVPLMMAFLLKIGEELKVCVRLTRE